MDDSMVIMSLADRQAFIQETLQALNDALSQANEAKADYDLVTKQALEERIAKVVGQSFGGDIPADWSGINDNPRLVKTK